MLNDKLKMIIAKGLVATSAFGVGVAISDINVNNAGMVLEAFAIENQTLSVTQIVSNNSSNASFILDSNGDVWATGNNSNYELGNNTATDSSLFIKVQGLSNIKEISAGSNFILALRSDGTVYAWGANNYGQLGDNTTTTAKTPKQIPGLTDIKQISSGQYHALALRSDGTVYAWGANNYGQLGDNTTTTVKTPKQIPGLTNIKKVNASNVFSLALTNDGNLYSWGYNSYGNLGIGSITTMKVPTQITDISNVKDIATGTNHTLAVTNDGNLYAWGYNQYGQIGNNTATTALSPVQITALSNVDKISAGGSSSYAVLTDGSLYSWGFNTSYQLGLNNNVTMKVPTYVTNNIAQVSSGVTHVLAMKTDNTVYVWGLNSDGQLGVGGTTALKVPNQLDLTIPIVYDTALTQVALAEDTQLQSDLDNATAIVNTLPTCIEKTKLTNRLTIVKNAINLKSATVAVILAENTEKQEDLDNAKVLVNVLPSSTDKTNLTNRLNALQIKINTNNATNAVVKAEESRVQVDVDDANTLIAKLPTGTNKTDLTNRITVVQNYINAKIAVEKAEALNQLGAVEIAQSLVDLLPVGSEKTNFTNRLNAILAYIDKNAITGDYTQVIDGGQYHTVALKSDGTVWTWGYNNYGQLGIGDTNQIKVPIKVAGLSNIVKISAGNNHVLALSADGTIYAWGYNQYGQVGNETTTVSPYAITSPVAVLTGVKDISAGYTHSVAVKNDGTVWAWGQNNYGQLGKGSTTPSLSNVPVQVPNLSGVKQVSAGNGYTIALTEDGTIYSWGYNSNGKLGIGNTSSVYIPTKIGIDKVVQITAGAEFALALRIDGTVWSWGANSSGQLGINNTTSYSTKPVQVNILTDVKQIHTGNNHALAIKADGTVWVWGENGYSQLGNNLTADIKEPIKLEGLDNIKQIDGGTNYSIAIDSNDNILTWGYNNYGQLGLNNTTTMKVPTKIGTDYEKMLNEAKNAVVKVESSKLQNDYDNALTLVNVLPETAEKTDLLARLTAVKTIIAVEKAEFTHLIVDINNARALVNTLPDGDEKTNFTNRLDKLMNDINDATVVKVFKSSFSESTFILKSDGTVWATGSNDVGQLGLGDTIQRTTPTQVSITNVENVIAGEGYTIFLKSDGTVWATGYNPCGQLGLGDRSQRIIPTKIDITNVKDVIAGVCHTIFIKNDGTIWGAGRNAFGELGLEDTSDKIIPTLIPITDVKNVIAGGNATFFLKTDGTVLATGKNDVGQLGLGDTTDRYTPTQVPITNIKDVIAGYYHTIFIKNDGTIWATGYNAFGQLGLGDTTKRTIPTQVSIPNVKKVITGTNYTIFVKSDGTIWATGYNFSGQLGLGDNTDRYTPTRVSVTNVKEVITKRSYTIFIKSDGTIWGAGDNTLGQLGLGDTTNRTTLTLLPWGTYTGIFEETPPITIEEATQAVVNAENTKLQVDVDSARTLINQLPDGDSKTNLINRLDKLINDINNATVVKIFKGLMGSGTFVLKSNGTVWATGFNSMGQLGLGDKAYRTTLTQVPISNVRDVIPGQYNTIFIKNDGTVWGVGSNDYGQLGLGDTTDRTTLTQISITDVKKVIAGQNNTFFIKNDGTVWATGDNNWGQLGFGDFTDRTIPKRISITNVKEVVIGYGYTIFIKNDGTVWGVGINDYGQLGLGDTNNRTIPIQASITNVKEVSAGQYYTIFIKNDGTVWGVGSNNYGRLSDTGDTIFYTTPIQISITDVRKVIAGQNNTFFIKNDDTVWAIGDNLQGQLGLGDTTDRTTLTQLPNGKEVITGYGYTIFIKSDGTIWGAGYNYQGQLGLGDTTNRTTLTLLPWGTYTGIFEEIPPITIEEATQAVVKAENSKLQADVDLARNLVNQLPDGTDKDSLNQRLDVVQAYIDYQVKVTKATEAVVKAETSKLQSDVDSARVLVNALNDPEKTDLNNRLDAVQSYIDNNNQLSVATKAVEKAETSKLQVDVDSARILVNALPDSPEKTDLTNRLNVVQAEIDYAKQLQEATDAVELAEISKDQDTVNIAQNLIDALKDSPEKTALQQRLDAVKNSLNNKKIQDKVDEINNKLDEIKDKINNGTVTDSDLSDLDNLLNDLDDLVNQLPNGTEVPPEVNDTQSEADLVKQLAEATQAVIKAENSKLQSDVDSARTLVNALPDGTDKTNLNNRLDAVQAEIDKAKQLQIATEAVVKAETSKLQSDINSARTLVNALPNSPDKTNLINRLDAIQTEIDYAKKLADAINAVIKAEGSKTQSDVDIARALVNVLNEPDKSSLNSRLDAVQNDINLKNQILKATEAVAKAETSKLQSDVDSARILVNALPLSTEKIDLTNRLDAVQDYINYQAKVIDATNAVIKAENSKLQQDVDSAKILVNALNEPEKTSLMNRLNVVQDAINLAKQVATATNAVVKAEGSLLQTDVDNARALVNALPNGTDKTNLTNRLDAVQAEIDYADKLAKAIQSVEKAEGTKLQSDVNSARILVGALKEKDKAPLNIRLDAIQDYINYQAKLTEATNAVIKAENSKIQTDVNSARTLVNALPDGTDKDSLTNRLNIVQLEIDKAKQLQDATNAVVKAEGSKIQSDVDSARTLVDALSDSIDKTNLNSRLDAVQNIINYQAKVAEATKAVVKAEGSKLQSDVDSAKVLVNALNDPEKTSLMNRLNTVQDAINLAKQISIATEAVVKAEGSKTQSDVDTARNLVNALPNGTDKTNLTNRLNAVQAEIDYADKLVKATEAVAKAETSQLQSDVDSARVLVNDLKAEDKTPLNSRLDAIQAKINYAKKLADATNAVVKAETSKLQSDVDIARTLVNVLNDPEKTTLNNRLDIVEQAIYNDLFNKALEAVDRAETNVTLDNYNSALSLVNKLKPGTDKTLLLNRLDAVLEKLNAEKVSQTLIDEATKAVEKAEIFKRDPYISTAVSKVNALPDCPEKTALLERLDAIQTKIEEDNLAMLIKSAETKVKQAESFKREPYFSRALEAVTSLPNCPEKDALLLRLKALGITPGMTGNTQAEIDKAISYVITAESIKKDYYYNKALEKVNTLKDSKEKTELLDRLAKLYKQMNPTEEEKAIMEATKYVETAEKYKYSYYINKAIDMVNALQDSPEKTALLLRLDDLK